MVDIGNTLTSYRYPHIVVSCDDDAANSAYSRVYGRILLDRCVLDGLLVEEREGVFVPKEEVSSVEVEGYYSYPTTHVTIRDLRGEGLEVRSKLCTRRGFEAAPFACAEAKQPAECSWCVFMKSGPCFRPFEAWQKCTLEFSESEMGKKAEQRTPEETEAATLAYINACRDVALKLKRCVDSHPEYYGKLSQPAQEQSQEQSQSEEQTPIQEQPQIEESPKIEEQPSKIEEPATMDESPKSEA